MAETDEEVASLEAQAARLHEMVLTFADDDPFGDWADSDSSAESPQGTSSKLPELRSRLAAERAAAAERDREYARRWKAAGERERALATLAERLAKASGPAVPHTGMWREEGETVFQYYCSTEDEEEGPLCTHDGVGEYAEAHWSCCGVKDRDAPCTRVPSARRQHVGHWREEGETVFEYYCSSPEETEGEYCTHEGVGEFCEAHWSCCGAKEKDSSCTHPDAVGAADTGAEQRPADAESAALPADRRSSRAEAGGGGAEGQGPLGTPVDAALPAPARSERRSSGTHRGAAPPAPSGGGGGADRDAAPSVGRRSSGQHRDAAPPAPSGGPERRSSGVAPSGSAPAAQGDRRSSADAGTAAAPAGGGVEPAGSDGRPPLEPATPAAAPAEPASCGQRGDDAATPAEQPLDRRKAAPAEAVPPPAQQPEAAAVRTAATDPPPAADPLPAAAGRRLLSQPFGVGCDIERLSAAKAVCGGTWLDYLPRPDPAAEAAAAAAPVRSWLAGERSLRAHFYGGGTPPLPDRPSPRRRCVESVEQTWSCLRQLRQEVERQRAAAGCV